MTGEQDFETDVCSINEINPEAVAHAQSQGMPEVLIDSLSRLYSALSDPTRLRILHSLTVIDELCVCDLAVITDLSVSAVSHQLRLLRDRQLVRARREGRMVYYSLSQENVRDLMACGVEHTSRS
jgi:DNA-binding transcriptional ArsR family regulator